MKNKVWGKYKMTKKTNRKLKKLAIKHKLTLCEVATIIINKNINF